MVIPSLAGGQVAKAVVATNAGGGAGGAAATESQKQQHIQQPTKPSVAHAVVQKKRGVFPSLLKKTKHNKAGAARLVPFSKKTLQPPVIKIDIIKPNSSDETKISSLTDYDGVLRRLEHQREATAAAATSSNNVLVARPSDKGTMPTSAAAAGAASRKTTSSNKKGFSHLLPPRKASHEIFSDQSVGPPPEEPSNKKVLELNNGFKLAAPSPITVDRVAVQGASENSSYAANSQKRKQRRQQQQALGLAPPAQIKKPPSPAVNVVSKLPSPRDVTPNLSPGGGQISPDSNRKILSLRGSPRHLAAAAKDSSEDTTTVELLNPLEGQVVPTEPTMTTMASRDPPPHQAVYLAHLPPSPVVEPRETKAANPSSLPPLPVPSSAVSTSANSQNTHKIAFEKVKELLNRVNGRGGGNNNNISSNSVSMVGCPSNVVQTMQSLYSRDHDSSFGLNQNSTVSTSHAAMMGPHLAAGVVPSRPGHASGSTSMEPPGSTSTQARSVQLPHPQDYRLHEMQPHASPERRRYDVEDRGSPGVERVESIPVVSSSGSMFQTADGSILRVSGSLRGGLDPNGTHSLTEELVLPHSASLVNRYDYGEAASFPHHRSNGTNTNVDDRASSSRLDHYERSKEEQRLRDTITEARMASNVDQYDRRSYEADTDRTNPGAADLDRPHSSRGTMYTSSYSLVQALQSSPRHMCRRLGTYRTAQTRTARASRTFQRRILIWWRGF
jgi:hypothetical protein